MATERLQKILAQAGLGSRRACEVLLSQGRVAVNGVTAGLGDSADPSRDKITVDGRPLKRPSSRSLVLAVHKPPGYVTTMRDTHGRPTVMELLPEDLPRLYPVGRLDLDSEGLLLFTNDGDLANALMHPSKHVSKTYRVKLRNMPTREEIRMLSEGIELEDGVTAPARVRLAGNNWLELELFEGKKRQVRRMLKALGYVVQRLVRVRVGPVELGRLKPGESRKLSGSELTLLRRAAGLESRSSRP